MLFDLKEWSFPHAIFIWYNAVRCDMQAEPASAVLAPKTMRGDSLLELLKQEHSALSNYQNRKFIGIAAARRVSTRDRILDWTIEHPLHRQTEQSADNHRLVEWICDGSYLLFAILVLAKLGRVPYFQALFLRL